jgi:hypothetical protein
LVELQDLLGEGALADQVMLGGELFKLLNQLLLSDLDDGGAGEDSGEQALQEGDVFGDQLGDKGVAQALNQDVLLPVYSDF